MDEYSLLKTTCRFLFPYVVIFGIYIILNGDLSPGGGFQGGVVLASAYFLIYFSKAKNVLNVKHVFFVEKCLFVALILLAFFTFFKLQVPPVFGNRTTLILFNLIIGFKVTLGIGGIISIYLEEGSL